MASAAACAGSWTSHTPVANAKELSDPGAGDGGEKRVIRAHADVAAGVELRAALSDDNHARRDLLAAELLAAEAAQLAVFQHAQ